MTLGSLLPTVMNTSIPGADLLPTITAIIEKAINAGEHGNPADYAHEVLAVIEDHYAERRDGLFNRKGLTRLARWVKGWKCEEGGIPEARFPL